MPIPTRSHSLRQPGFSKSLSGRANAGASDGEGKLPRQLDETLGPSQDAKDDRACERNQTESNGYYPVMGPPSRHERSSSVQKPSRKALEPFHGATQSLTNASGANTSRRHDKSALPAQPTSLGAPTVRPRPQATEHLEATLASTADDNFAQHRVPLHLRSQSVGGLVKPPADPGQTTRTHSREVSVSSQRLPPPPPPPPAGLPRPGQGENPSRTTKLTAGKPQFSTYQQHFSPKKPANALVQPILGRSSNQHYRPSKISTDLSTSIGPGDDTISSPAQTSQLQDELLQLQMIHGSASSQQHIYLQNTMQTFKEQFAILSRDERVLEAQEVAYSTKMNRLALREWLGQGDLSCPGKIQTLAQCVQDITTLTAPEGKLSMAIAQFETWFQTMVLVSRRRSSGTALPDYHDALVSPLGPEWHGLVADLQRRLDQCSRILGDLGSAREGSGLAMVLEAHTLFVDNLQQELKYCSTIERCTLQQEQSWIAESISRIMRDDDPTASDSRSGHVRRAAWSVDMA